LILENVIISEESVVQIQKRRIINEGKRNLIQEKRKYRRRKYDLILEDDLCREEIEDLIQGKMRYHRRKVSFYT
jgi:hypothetical protein